MSCVNRQLHDVNCDKTRNKLIYLNSPKVHAVNKIDELTVYERSHFILKFSF